MQIAIPIWRERVSPLFDSAGCVLMVRLEDGEELDRWRLRLRGYHPGQRLHLLMMAQIDILICGALSGAMRGMMESAGVTVIAWRTGLVEDVLRAYLNDNLDEPRFLLPGRCLGPGRGIGHRIAGGRGGQGRGRGMGRGMYSQGKGKGR